MNFLTLGGTSTSSTYYSAAIQADFSTPIFATYPLMLTKGFGSAVLPSIHNIQFQGDDAGHVLSQHNPSGPAGLDGLYRKALEECAQSVALPLTLSLTGFIQEARPAEYALALCPSNPLRLPEGLSGSGARFLLSIPFANQPSKNPCSSALYVDDSKFWLVGSGSVIFKGTL
ncbi:unnamed protein product [Calicophoron daubneyi]|uniref:Peptidase A1 domain-containing protein n=1 Tax=Calicophoron daubneyi TaxID=300641 RepID=A0AAV2T7N0_CALDB